jgi:hypothetical protein
MFPMRLALVLLSMAYAVGQPPSVHFRLGTVGNQTQFRVGQAIPVTLDFETDSSQIFRVDTDVRIRHLELQEFDVFTATPQDGFVDPLEHLRWNRYATMPGAGFPSANLDSLHPVRIERDLNEFIVFRKPGHYLVHAASDRVRGQSLQSNDIPLDIVPRDNAWTVHEFETAKTTLEAGKPPKEPERVFYQDKENVQIDAVRTLCYLETESAVAYLASIYGQGRRTDREIEYALYSSPYPEIAAGKLEQQMGDQELTITQSYMATLLGLRARVLASKNGRPLSDAERVGLDESLSREAFDLAAHKSPQARADTYFFVFETGSKTMRGSPEVRRKVIESLPFASDYTLSTALTQSWGRIKDVGPALVPVLKQAASRSSAPWAIHVSGIALLRLRQLDPAAANEIAFKELLSGQSLEEDPQLLEFSFPSSHAIDEALLSQYRQGKQVDARMGRFASAGIEADVWRAYDARLASQPQGAPACATPLFAYFFQVDPLAAGRRLAEMREQPGLCTALQFYNFERQLMSPGLEHQLILDAKSADQNIRRDAFQMLRAAGSGTALPALMEDLKTTPATDKGDLILAIVHGRNFFITERDFAQLKTECLSTQFCSEVQQIERDFQRPYTLQMFDFAGHDGFWLSGHPVDSLEELGDMLMQFVPGSTFRWLATSKPIKHDESERRDMVRAVLKKHGMTLLE